MIAIQCPYCGRYFPIEIEIGVRVPTLDNYKRVSINLRDYDKILIDILKFSEKGIEKEKLYIKIKEIYGIDRELFEKLIQALYNDGLLYSPKIGYVKSLI